MKKLLITTAVVLCLTSSCYSKNKKPTPAPAPTIQVIQLEIRAIKAELQLYQQSYSQLERRLKELLEAKKRLVLKNSKKK